MSRHGFAWLGGVAFAAASFVGCASLSGQQTAPPSNVVPASATAPGEDDEKARRAQYIEQKYRDDFDPIQPKRATGLDALSPDNLKASMRELTGKGPSPTIARQLFAEAEELYSKATNTEGDARIAAFTAAAEKYVEAAQRWPDSMLEEDAQFMAGESYFFADNYPKANEQYESLVKKHPNTRHMDQVDSHRFAIAQYWIDLDRKQPQPFYSINWFDKRRPWRDSAGHAYRVFDKIRIDDPTGKLSDDATMAAANAYFTAGDYFKADSLYTDLRKTFPSSEHQFNAHLLGLETKILCYDGPEYSGLCLDQAEELIKQIRKQFPREAEKEDEALRRAWATVRFKKAERNWTLARFHHNRQEFRAAQIFYERIVKEYADTPFADKAREASQEIAGKPPVPAQPLPWLVDLFPQRENAKPLLSSSTPTATTGKKR